MLERRTRPGQGDQRRDGHHIQAVQLATRTLPRRYGLGNVARAGALKTIGTAAAVPALAALLADEKLSHMARYALERIPAPEAGQAMRDALPKVAPKLKIGMLASLGVRGEAASLPPLTALLADSDAAVAVAAAHALGDIGSLEAAKALVTAKSTAATKAAIADASLECAEHLVATGNKPAAKITYEKLLASTPSKPVKDAATLGMAALAAK